MSETAVAPMLDPTWTPERGLAHAWHLLRIIEEAEERARRSGGDA